MKLGDIQTCAECGATSEPLHDRGGEPGSVLIATWLNGPVPRHVVASELEPVLCGWCGDRSLGFPALSRRPDRGEAWEVGGPRLRFFVPAWRGAPARKEEAAPVEAASMEPRQTAYSGSPDSTPTPDTGERPAAPAQQLGLFA